MSHTPRFAFLDPSLVMNTVPVSCVALHVGEEYLSVHRSISAGGNWAEFKYARHTYQLFFVPSFPQPRIFLGLLFVLGNLFCYFLERNIFS
jgi:hypothetical protein